MKHIIKHLNGEGKNMAGRIFEGNELHYCNFIDANLSAANFSGSTLVGVDFRGADLSAANFSGSTLVGVDFRGADVSLANFSGANFGQSLFYPAQMGGAILDGADLTAARIDSFSWDIGSVSMIGTEILGMWANGEYLTGDTLRQVLNGGELSC